MKEFVKGQRIKLADLTSVTTIEVSIKINFTNLKTLDYSCFGVDANNQLSDDRYFIFYNQKQSPDGSLKLLSSNVGGIERFRIALSLLPQNICKLVFTAALDDEGTMSEIKQGYLCLSSNDKEMAKFHFNGLDFSTEKAIILAELYFKEEWRFSAVGQGFSGGLRELLKHFGGEEESDSELPQNLQQIPSHPTENHQNPTKSNIQNAPSGNKNKRICNRCGKKIGFFGMFSFNQQTGYCDKCESDIQNCLQKFRRLFLIHCQDRTLTDLEWEVLTKAVQRDRLDMETALIFIRKDAIKFLEYSLSSALADGMLTDQEEKDFHQLQTKLAIPTDLAKSLFEKLTNSKEIEFLREFRELFLLYCKDGVLSDLEWQGLKQVAQQYRLNMEKALAFIRGDALSFLERTLLFAFADGILTNEEESDFFQLKTRLAISDSLAKPLLKKLTYLKNITSIRQGNLPVIQPSVVLESEEVCHLESSATYRKVMAKSVKEIGGRLIATSKQLHFVSQDGGWRIKIASIMRIEELPGKINLELSTKNGNGNYSVPDPLLVSAVIDSLVRTHKRQLLIPQTERSSRLVPHHVRLEVWHRDQGKCVQCGNKEYLEYDHIIPYSKGGASTTKNIQLLCRKCNLAKGDHI